MTRADNRPDRSERKRVPVGSRDVLNAPEREGYKRRFVNDEDGRIQAFLDAGYTIVEGKTQMGDKSAGDASQLGSVARKPVGGGTNAVLMEIKQDWFKEDQDAKEARLKEKEQGLLLDQNGRQPEQANLYGEGISIKHARPAVQSE